MGRRAHPLVVTFFERGGKLENNSNRYRQTCKKCGKAFPKGRTEVLTQHVLQKCPSVTQVERQWGFQQVRCAHASTEAAQNRDDGGTIRRAAGPEEPNSSDRPLVLSQPQSALETLAEASWHKLQAPVPWQERNQSRDNGSDFVNDGSSSGLQQKPETRRSRGRFDEERRQKIGVVRKCGACIRCRMLKKPCSEETPCSTCRNIRTASRWKGPCFRKKLAEACTLYSAGFFRRNVETDVSYTFQQDGFDRRIEARLLPESNIVLSLPVRLHASHPRTGEGQTADDANGLWLLPKDSDAVGKLEAYADNFVDELISKESNTCRSITLQRAQAMRKATTEIQEIDTSSHPSYNLRPKLLEYVVRLWALTQMLIAAEDHGFDLRWSSNSGGSALATSTINDDDSEEHASINGASRHYQLLRSQITAAIESACASLSRSVTSELERRFLQRRQVSRFATLLSAVLLLDCVEHMSDYYQRCSSDRHDAGAEPRAGSETPVNPQGQIEISTVHPSPATLCRQGVEFADLLIMLLHLRGLVPRTTFDADGTLVVIQDEARFAKHRRVPARGADSEDDELVASWLEQTNISVKELMAAKDASLTDSRRPDPASITRALAKVLLPQRDGIVSLD